MSRTSTHRTMSRTLKLFPYRYQLIQELNEENKSPRISMCECLLEILDNDPHFLNRIIFLDEAKLTIHRCMNRHNIRIWGNFTSRRSSDTGAFKPKSESLDRHDTIYGPFFFSGNTINEVDYESMLTTCFIPLLKKRRYSKTVFQQDGSPPHYSNAFPQR